MARRLLIDESPFGMRAMLTVDDAPVQLVHHFAMRCEPRVGQIFWARAGARDERLGGQVFELGQAGEGLMPVKDRVHPEGAMVMVGIRREPIDAKKALLTDRPFVRLPCVSFTSDGMGRPGPLGSQPAPDQLLQAVRSPPPKRAGVLAGIPDMPRLIALIADAPIDGLVCSSGDLAAAVQRFIPQELPVEIDDAIDRFFLAGEEAAVSRTEPLPGGGRLVFDQAEALTAIDLDIGNRAARSGQGAAAAALRAALKTLGRGLTLRAIGGQVVLDLPRQAVKAPKMLRDQLTAALKGTGLSSIPAVTKEGLVIMLLRQQRRPLIDDLTEERGGGPDLVRPARRLREDIAAWRAYSEASALLRGDRSGRYALTLPQELAAEWTRTRAEKNLNRTFGHRLSVSAERVERWRFEPL